VIRWATAGALLGGLLVLIAFAPAAWLAEALFSATDQRLLLADARGTVWHGSAVLVLTGGAGSRDASALPGRLQWSLTPEGAALALRARHVCCLNGELRLRLMPGPGRLRVELLPVQGAIGQWPAAWLVGLGTPWNTMQPSGSLQLSSSGLVVERVQGRWSFSGDARLDLQAMASRLSTLEVLGSYRLSLHGDAVAGEATNVQLATTSGALQLAGSGQWGASGLRFSGQASAAAGAEAALNNLLNIIGRRQGALSLIAIG
jgi:general secretion pathway protein N